MVKNDIEKLADMACEIDYLREKFLNQEWRAVLTECVAQLHGVAQSASTEFGFKVYAEGGD